MLPREAVGEASRWLGEDGLGAGSLSTKLMQIPYGVVIGDLILFCAPDFWLLRLAKYLHPLAPPY